MKWKKLKAWLLVIITLETSTTLISLAAMGKRRATSPGEGNKIARLVLDDPGKLESFIFYFIGSHLLIGFIFFVAWVVTKRKQI